MGVGPNFHPPHAVWVHYLYAYEDDFHPGAKVGYDADILVCSRWRRVPIFTLGREACLVIVRTVMIIMWPVFHAPVDDALL